MRRIFQISTIRLSPIPLVLAALVLSGCQTGGGPTLALVEETGSTKARDKSLYRVSSRSSSASSRNTHRIANLTYIVPKGAGWSVGRAMSYSSHVPRRFAECGIGFSSVQLISTDLKSRGVNARTFTRRETGKYWAAFRKMPDVKGVRVLFTNTIREPGLDADIGGVAINVGGPPLAVIAGSTRAGRRLSSAQIVAHEIGHLLGLPHKRARAGSADLMQPGACRNCSFTKTQCQQMKRHPLVRRVG